MLRKSKRKNRISSITREKQLLVLIQARVLPVQQQNFFILSLCFAPVEELHYWNHIE
jgi:hypothetical protein